MLIVQRCLIWVLCLCFRLHVAGYQLLVARDRAGFAAIGYKIMVSREKTVAGSRFQGMQVASFRFHVAGYRLPGLERSNCQLVIGLSYRRLETGNPLYFPVTRNMEPVTAVLYSANILSSSFSMACSCSPVWLSTRGWLSAAFCWVAYHSTTMAT
ncbi:hypothetical protein ABIE54_000453 [Chitinophagaceae bacterium OAS944]